VSERPWIGENYFEPQAEDIPFGEGVTFPTPLTAEEEERAGSERNGAAPDAGRLQVAVASVTWERLLEVEMRSIVFVDKPLLQADAFHLVAGRKGMGKGTLLSEVAARVNRGELGDKRNVVWIGSEDSAAIDIKPRIVAAGGDPARVLVVKEGWIQLPRDYGEIRRAMIEFGEVGMVVVDPVGNHITGTNSNSDTDVRDAIAPMNAVADEHECLAFGVRHLSEKECARGVLAAILGASAWVHVPRAVLAVVRDDDDPQISHVQCEQAPARHSRPNVPDRRGGPARA
jgi:AAA domain